MNTTIVTDQIVHIQRLRAELFDAEKELFNMQLHTAQKSTLKNVNDSEKSERTSVVVLVLACIVMLIVVLSGWVMHPDVSNRENELSISVNPNKRIDCHLYDGQFDECVAGQRSGNGCSWYADCSKCISSSEVDPTSICAKK